MYKKRAKRHSNGGNLGGRGRGDSDFLGWRLLGGGYFIQWVYRENETGMRKSETKRKLETGYDDVISR